MFSSSKKVDRVPEARIQTSKPSGHCIFTPTTQLSVTNTLKVRRDGKSSTAGASDD